MRDADRVGDSVGVRVGDVERVDVADAEPPRESVGDGVGVGLAVADVVDDGVSAAVGELVVVRVPVGVCV